MRPNRLILAFALVLPALSSCGGAQALDPATSESLQQQVRELATLTQEGNLEGALSQADALKAEVQAAEESGAVTPGRALRIQDNIDAFIASIQVEAPAPAPAPSPSTVPPAEPAPVPTVTAPAKGGEEDSRDPGETQSDKEREAEEKAAEEAQKQAEKEEKERQKQEEDREDD
jgi:hypothetical protein